MNSKNRSLIGVAAAVLLALVGGFLLWQNSDAEESQAQEVEVEEQQVLVAARDIGRGEAASTLSDNAFTFVQVRTVPVDQVRPGALTSVADLASLANDGNVTNDAIVTDAQITAGAFVIPGQQVVSALPDVDANLFEMTVALEAQRAFGGNLRAGMTVAVIGSFDPSDGSPAQTVVLLDSALVTNVQSEQLLTREHLSSDPLAPSLAPTSRLFVTFGVPVEDLERLAFVTEFGHIWLARQGSSASVEGSVVRDRGSVVVSLGDPAETTSDPGEATAPTAPPPATTDEPVAEDEAEEAG